MSKAPGFVVGIPQSALLSEIDASLQKAFADFHQRACQTVGDLISAASIEKTFAQDRMIRSEKLTENGASQLPPVNTTLWAGDPELLASLDEPLPSRAWQSLAEFAPTRQAESKWSLPALDDFDTQVSQDSELALCDKSPSKASVSRSPSKQSGQEEEQTSITLCTSPSRRSSFSATEADLAALRKEFDSHQQHDDASVKENIWCTAKAFLSSACQCKGGFEPKDLHFDKLAAQRGKRWKELSLSDQVNIISEELSRSSCMIDPQADLMKIWDVLIIFCLLFTAVVCPYEMAFLETSFGALYLINHTIDVVFLVDMMLQFFLKVRIRTRQKSTWLRNRRKIAIAYLRSWFVVDLLSVVPYDDISTFATNQFGSSGLEHLKIMRLLRVLRLLKLFRMLKAFGLAKRWENRNGLPSSTKHLMKCFILILASIHWMACIWGFFGRWEGANLKCRNDLPDHDPLVRGSPRASWYVQVEEGWAHNNPTAWRGQSWVVAFALGRAASTPIDPCYHLHLYFVSIYWAVMTMTSIGYGDVVPQTLVEYIVNSVCMVTSGIIWAYIIGVASSVLSNSYPEIKEFEQSMDAFNAMVKDMQVPTKIKLRGREFIRESRYKTSHERNLKVIQSLGFDLQTHLSKQSAQLYFGSINLFHACSELFCADCAAQMLPHFFEPHYLVQPDGQLFVVEKGAMGHEGRVLVPFNHWGEDFIVTKVQLRSQSPAIALNYALVVSLSSESLENVLAHHPQEREHFRRRAVCMAFRGAMRIYFDDLQITEIRPEHKWIHALFATINWLS